MLSSFFQTGGLAILVMLSFLLPFCDSFHALIHEFNGTSTSFDLIKQYTYGTYDELHTLLEINMELFLFLLLMVFAVRYLAIPMSHRIDTILDRIHNGVHQLILTAKNAAHQFVNCHITVPARLSRIEAALASKDRVKIKSESSRCTKLLRRQLKSAKRHLGKRAIEAFCNTNTITNLTAANCAGMNVLPILVLLWAKTPEDVRSKVQQYARIEHQLQQVHLTYSASNEQYKHTYKELTSSFDIFERHYTELKAAGENANKSKEMWLAEKEQRTYLENQLDEAQHDVESYQEELQAKTEENADLVEKIYEPTTRCSDLHQAAPSLGEGVTLMQASLCDLQKENSDCQGTYAEQLSFEKAADTDTQKLLLGSKPANQTFISSFSSLGRSAKSVFDRKMSRGPIWRPPMRRHSRLKTTRMLLSGTNLLNASPRRCSKQLTLWVVSQSLSPKRRGDCGGWQ